MTDYQYLQKICDRFPDLFGLKTVVFQDKIIVRMTDGKDFPIIEKEIQVDGTFNSKQQIEDLKNDCAFDIISSLCLGAFSNIKKAMSAAIVRKQADLN